MARATGPSEPFTSLRFAPNGRLVAASADGTISIFVLAASDAPMPRQESPPPVKRAPSATPALQLRDTAMPAWAKRGAKVIVEDVDDEDGEVAAPAAPPRVAGGAAVPSTSKWAQVSTLAFLSTLSNCLTSSHLAQRVGSSGYTLFSDIEGNQKVEAALGEPRRRGVKDAILLSADAPLAMLEDDEDVAAPPPSRDSIEAPGLSRAVIGELEEDVEGAFVFLEEVAALDPKCDSAAQV